VIPVTRAGRIYGIQTLGMPLGPERGPPSASGEGGERSRKLEEKRERARPEGREAHLDAISNFLNRIEKKRKRDKVGQHTPFNPRNRSVGCAKEGQV